MSFTLRVENLKALRRVEWSPEGVCALVGANGAGKSTLLQVLKFLRVSAERGIEEGFRQIFITNGDLRSRGSTEKIRVGAQISDVSWMLTLNLQGASIALPVEESISGAQGWTRAESGQLTGFPGRSKIGHASYLAIDHLAQEQTDAGRQARGFLDTFSRIRVYHDPDLWALRTQGSPTTEAPLLSRSSNAFGVLRMWHERREHRHRYQFVVAGLQAAFPGSCVDLDFESAGQTTFARIWPPGSELPTPTVNEANGVHAMLVYLCNIASGEPGGLVAIDEPENSLHPHAIHQLVESAELWSQHYDATIVLATHSTVILDKLSGRPEQVWVMRAAAGDESNPTRLDRLKNPAWLSHFAFGTLYANGEIGSNDDAA